MSNKIVKDYLDLVKNFPEEFDITTDEAIGAFRSELGEEVKLNTQQTDYKKRTEEVRKRQKDFFKKYTYDEVVLLFTAYEYGKELRSNDKIDVESFHDSIQREVSGLSKDELVHIITGNLDWIVKDSLQKYLNNFV